MQLLALIEVVGYLAMSSVAPATLERVPTDPELFVGQGAEGKFNGNFLKAKMDYWEMTPRSLLCGMITLAIVAGIVVAADVTSPAQATASSHGIGNLLGWAY